MNTTVIKGGNLVSSRGMDRMNLYIKDGIIDTIEPEGAVRPARQEIDATGNYVLPGFIDAHLHPVYADTMDTLSRAAASEGITTLIPYIGAVKAWGQSKGLLDTIDEFIETTESSSLVDFSIHCTLLQDDIKDISQTIPLLIERGIVSFKAFMAYSKRGMMLEDPELIRIMELIGQYKGILAAHAENGVIIDYLEAYYQSQGLDTPEYIAKSHPNLSEAEAIFRLLTLGATTSCPIYIPHISCAESIEVVKMFKRWGQPSFYTETCPHYLTLTDDIFNKMGTIAKMSPPVRKQKDIDILWKAVGDGVIDVIASDAAGHMQASNAPFREKVFSAPNGIPGTESLIKVIYEEGVNQQKTSLPVMVQQMCENPSRIFGLYPQKGVLKVGSDADLVIINPETPYTIPPKNPHLNVDYSMYGGRKGTGIVQTTILRGDIIMNKAELTETGNTGRFVPAQKINTSNR
ncbi:MAG: amidohydrolase family protein [Bacteroidetes bacterium]|jgi:dihydropyrimidinase|nr:amidohydrolase family protein [Bacteroidota bacterium]